MSNFLWKKVICFTNKWFGIGEILRRKIVGGVFQLCANYCMWLILMPDFTANVMHSTNSLKIFSKTLTLRESTVYWPQHHLFDFGQNWTGPNPIKQGAWGAFIQEHNMRSEEGDIFPKSGRVPRFSFNSCSAMEMILHIIHLCLYLYFSGIFHLLIKFACLPVGLAWFFSKKFEERNWEW